MNGVTVIAEHTVKNIDKSGYIGVCILSLFVVIAAICIVAISIHDFRAKGGRGNIVYAILFSMIAIMCTLLFLVSVKNLSDNSTHMEYTVILDENASYLEFTEKYKVLSEEDGVYRVMLVQENA